MKRKLSALIALTLSLLLVLSACGGSTGSSASPSPTPSASAAASTSPEAAMLTSAIMLPGTLSDNAIFQMFVNGVKDAAAQLGYPEPKVVEGGDDWDSYAKNMVTLSESGKYNIIVTCTESMCDSVLECGNKYPNIKYILLNGTLTDKDVPANVFAVRFKNEDLGYLGGYFCGLVTKSNMEYANKDLKVGLLFADVYEPWETQTKPAFIKGAQAVDPNIEVVNSVVGDWVDAMKGAETARAMYAQGVDIIWYTTGSSTYGAVTEAEAEGKYATASDNDSTDLSKNIPGCTMITGYDYAKNAFLKAADGTLEFGKALEAGAAEGVISFTFDDPDYKQRVPEDIQKAMKDVYQKLASGEINPIG